MRQYTKQNLTDSGFILMNEQHETAPPHWFRTCAANLNVPLESLSAFAVDGQFELVQKPGFEGRTYTEQPILPTNHSTQEEAA